MSEKPKTISQAKAVTVVGLMFAMFIVPYVYVLYIYKTGEIPTSNTTEKGVFFKPFIELEKHQLRLLDQPETFWHKTNMENKFALLNVVDKNCEQHCLERVFNTQQAITALTRYQGRVEQIVLIHPEKSQDQDLQTIVHLKDYVHSVINTSLLNELNKQIPNHADLSGFTVIVDPEARLLLWYGPEQSLQDILRDIKRLLKSSPHKYSSEQSISPDDTNSPTIETKHE